MKDSQNKITSFLPMNHFLSVLFGELMGKIPPHEGKDLKLLMVTSTKSAPQIKSHQKSTDILVIAVVGWLGWLVGWSRFGFFPSRQVG